MSSEYPVDGTPEEMPLTGYSLDILCP